MVVAIAWNASTPIVHKADDKRQRLMTEQENTTQREKSEKEHSINAVQFKVQEHGNDHRNWRNTVENSDENWNTG